MSRIITLCKLVEVDTNAQRAEEALNKYLSKAHELGLNPPEIKNTRTKAILVFTLTPSIVRGKEKEIREFFGVKHLPDL